MKIILFAFTQNNLGDDLFIRILTQKYSHITFYLPELKSRVNQTIASLDNVVIDETLYQIVESIKKESIINNHLHFKTQFVLKHYQKYLKQFQASVYITGSAFMQSGPNKSYSNLLLIEKMVQMTPNFFLINANFGPYFDERYLKQTRQLIASMTDACVRDQYSYQMLQSVRYGSDIVFSLSEKPTSTQNTILISVMNLGQIYEDFIQECINILNKHYKIVLVSFCKNQQDTIVLERLAFLSNVQTLSYHNNLDTILEAFKTCTGVIATRFHAVVLGLVFHKKVLSIAYNQKITQLLKDIQYPISALDPMQLNNISISDCIETFLNTEYELSDTYIKLSKKQTEALDSYLKEE